METVADVGLIGLAVMGENLVLNMESKGYTVAVFNRTVEKVEHFTMGRGRGRRILGTASLEELIGKLKSPRKIIMMIRAGTPVDELIGQLIPYLDKGDILIDGGNSRFTDTIRRCRQVEEKGLLYIGTGISGGEEGALTGPSIMPGGSGAAWPHVKELFLAIAAKAGDGTPCCDWVGNDGAGHFVKMVHNGIEYGDMQLICEGYHILKNVAGLNHKEMHRVFADWNKGDLNSYLIGITSDIMDHTDKDGMPLLEKILDAAGQKGTGKWTGTEALEQGVPLTLITEAVFARALSAMKNERRQAAALMPVEAGKTGAANRDVLIRDLKDALLASKIVSYAQGFALLKAASMQYGWDLNMGSIALMWREGCIIRSAFLEKIRDAYEKNPQLSNLMVDPYFIGKLVNADRGWRRTVHAAIMNQIPVPSISSGLAYYDGYRTEKLPANLIQAQRDYFGAHTYERVDHPRGVFFHTNWTGKGGETSSSVYGA